MKIILMFPLPSRSHIGYFKMIIGKKENLNFSEVLTEALRDRLDV